MAFAATFDSTVIKTQFNVPVIAPLLVKEIFDTQVTLRPVLTPLKVSAWLAGAEIPTFAVSSERLLIAPVSWSHVPFVVIEAMPPVSLFV